ncbi:phosphotransferase family protein [Streptomyces parvulus]|uniref:phosphotransferase family protein n=1 Tax=Streptomyces parvulus TaxID=146923 RepID=UPI003718FA1D
MSLLPLACTFLPLGSRSPSARHPGSAHERARLPLPPLPPSRRRARPRVPRPRPRRGRADGRPPQPNPSGAPDACHGLRTRASPRRARHSPGTEGRCAVCGCPDLGLRAGGAPSPRCAGGRPRGAGVPRPVRRFRHPRLRRGHPAGPSERGRQARRPMGDQGAGRHTRPHPRCRSPELPPLPPGWPASGDSRGFLRTLVRTADEQIVRPNWNEFRSLFKALGVPRNALTRLGERVPHMASRPFGLLHADLHRNNVLETGSSVALILPVDLELATFGDSLHDLATHLVRTRYPAHQWGEVIDAWYEAMMAWCPDATWGLESDLRHYVNFERAQSVFPDVMRAARSLREAADGEALAAATDQVCRAVETASEPLGLKRVPNPGEVEEALSGWLSRRRPGIRVARGLSDDGPRRVTGGSRRAPRAESPAGLHPPAASRRRERAFLGERALLRLIGDLGERVTGRLLIPCADGVWHLGHVGARLSRRALRRVAAAWRACADGLGRLAAGVRLAVRDVRRAVRVAWEMSRQGGGRGLGVVGA